MRLRSKVLVQQLTQFHDRFGAVSQQIVAPVLPCHALCDRPGQSTRPCTPRRQAHQPRQGCEAGRRDKVVLKAQPIPQFVPRLGVLFELHPLQEFGDAFDIPVAVPHLRPVHHAGS